MREQSVGAKSAPEFIDETSVDPGPAIAATRGPDSSENLGAILEVGTVLGGRYEILEMLGVGGMGAVYKAHDRELDRIIALKVVRPDLARDPAILQRFKQELLTARQVTHKNVIRIFDLAEADGVKFITMEYVAGHDLRRLLADRGKLPAAEAIGIIQQVCAGVAAAHAEGVIHRDLKPGNIMRDAQGRVVVMDFGLARTVTGDGMTKTGALLGTVEYMSPEQARAEKLDARSDLFTIGLILYELLTGKTPYKADSAIASLLKRTQEAAVPAHQADPAVPRGLSDIVSKALERDPNQRYQSVREFIDRLDEYQGKGPTGGSRIRTIRLPQISALRWGKPTLWGVATVVVLAIAVLAGMMLRGKFVKVPAAKGKAVRVLVADFTNHTGDPVFDGTLEPMLNVALEGASFIDAFNRGTARKLAGQLPHPTDKLDEQSARLVAIGQGVGAIVTGSLSRRGDGYKLSVEAMDAMSGKTIASADVNAASKDEVLLTVPKLAVPVRKALGDTTPESVQLNSATGTFTAASLEAVHEYGRGMEQQFAGQYAEALRSFSKAVELDPTFARAYAGMAAVSGNLGKAQDAEKYVKLAMEHVDRMTERERYRVRGVYYFRTGDWQKCTEEYGELVKQYPGDNIAHNNLALCLSELRSMQKAVEEVRRAVEIDPNSAPKRVNLSLFSSYASDFRSGEREARGVLRLSPSYEIGYIALAFAQLGQGQLSQAAESYHNLEKISASDGAAGLGDLALYEGRISDSIKIFENAAAADAAAKSPDRAAEKLIALAYAQVLRGQKKAATRSAQQALADSQSIKVRFLAAHIFLETGEVPNAQKLAASLASDVRVESQAYAKLIGGEIALQRHDAQQAVITFNQARNMLDTWISHFDLARAYLEAGAFAEADSELDRCINRRGEALALFLDEVPTYAYFPLVYYYQGRVRDGLKSPGALDSYRTYLSIRDKAGEDPLLSDIHRRLGQ